MSSSPEPTSPDAKVRFSLLKLLRFHAVSVLSLCVERDGGLTSAVGIWLYNGFA